MTDILRNNWFVVLIAIIIIGFIGYFIYDTNKDNVSAKTTNNEQVVASINKDDITADDLYDESTPYDGSTIYNMYKNAVIDQSIKTTKDLKKQASTLESNIKSNASSQSDDYESTLTTELAKYGYASYEELNDYCLTSVKEKEMNKKYITKHFDEVKKAWEEKKPITAVASATAGIAATTAATEIAPERSIDFIGFVLLFVRVVLGNSAVQVHFVAVFFHCRIERIHKNIEKVKRGGRVGADFGRLCAFCLEIRGAEKAATRGDVIVKRFNGSQERVTDERRGEVKRRINVAFFVHGHGNFSAGTPFKRIFDGVRAALGARLEHLSGGSSGKVLPQSNKRLTDGGGVTVDNVNGRTAGSVGKNRNHNAQRVKRFSGEGKRNRGGGVAVIILFSAHVDTAEIV